MSQVVVCIDDKGKPANIPDLEMIITRSFDERDRQATATNTSGVRIDLDKRSDLDVSSIWVKSGRNITMGEANMQRFVAEYLQNNNISAVRAPRVYLAFTWGIFGFIVTEYIDGQTCGYSDISLVAAAVQALINIRSPTLKPGPVGGGLMEHPFFVDRKSCIQYESVEELQDHVNGILSETGRRGRVNFASELANYGLRLCVSDLVPVNFMKDSNGGIVAVDFGGYSFLPPSFFAFTLRYGGCSNFALRVARTLEYPSPPNVTAMAFRRDSSPDFSQ
ncbi:hypothetical protein NLJ89_g8924 [Agrocybe chaxingu]|uniref:Aminoglycoside phosphotransferase domain-containing protein n=1 Tax=Agrocybe chaxingu TaxID=84603 RepID=A0A9W8JUI5_9AGAR|nr:hypothetical protein NLJ89_g8924 [Agrocybe chaxingu]